MVQRTDTLKKIVSHDKQESVTATDTKIRFVGLRKKKIQVQVLFDSSDIFMSKQLEEDYNSSEGSNSTKAKFEFYNEEEDYHVSVNLEEESTQDTKDYNLISLR
eukprot:Ihof_evm4s386 gene=Ihof_evmTU4s386